jgi:MFS family permease
MKKLKKILLILALGTVILVIGLILFGTIVHAAGLVDDKVDSKNIYSMYSLDNYQLDFYVDNSWGWLPWNWGDGIGKQVMYGLYAISNFIWTISLYLSNATGYLIQEAYKLDFISQTADAIGKNIQTIAGITRHGFSSSGFYVGFLLILVLALGIYVAYTGLLKRETSKAIQAVMNFLLVFILSASFIAYAPDYIKKINEFSSDISKASLEVGTKIILPHSESKGKDSVDLIRDSLFSIQVEQPWLLLQYDNSNPEEIGEERIKKLVSTSPDLNDGKDREKIVKEEIENQKNNQLTITKTINRLGMAFFLFLFNIGISIFVFLLTGIMIFSQVLFIIYAMFLPISFLLSMIPSFNGTSKKAIMKLFNVIMTRAGITLIITVAFSISTMLYSLSANSPFFMTAFLQIVTFAGIYFKLGDLMSMFSLQSSDSQGVGKQIMRRPRMMIHRQTRNLQRKLGRSMALAGLTTVATSKDSKNKVSQKKGIPSTKQPSVRENESAGKPTTSKPTIARKLGQTTGNMLDTKQKLTDKTNLLKDQIKSLPTQTKYALHQKKEGTKEAFKQFSTTAKNTPKINHRERLAQQRQHRETIAQKRLEMDKAKNARKSTGFTLPTREMKLKRPEHLRPNVPSKRENNLNKPSIPTRTPSQIKRTNQPVTKLNNKRVTVKPKKIDNRRRR